MIRIRLLALPFAALLLATACMGSFGGPLDPVPAAGMEIGADHAVFLKNGSLTARVTGQWSGKDSNSLLIVYHNGGPAPRTVAIHALKMTHPSGEAALRTTDRRAISTLLACARDLHPAAAETPTPDVPAGPE